MNNDRAFKDYIRELEEEWGPLGDFDYQDHLHDLACEYAAENPGDYYVIFPGIILPIFS